MLIKYKSFWFFQNYIYFIFITDFASRTVTIWLILIAWPDSPKPEGPPSLTCWVSLSEVSSFFNHKHKYRNTSASGALSILIRTVSSKWQEESGNGSFWDEIWYQVRQWQIVHHRWGWTMIWRGDQHHGTYDIADIHQNTPSLSDLFTHSAQVTTATTPHVFPALSTESQCRNMSPRSHGQLCGLIIHLGP